MGTSTEKSQSRKGQGYTTRHYKAWLKLGVSKPVLTHMWAVERMFPRKNADAT